jgi:hypothetical protein
MVLHTPLWHTRIAAGTEHVPSSVGSVCAGSVGRGAPLLRKVVHAAMLSLHQPPGQSVSALQVPAAGRQRPSVLHAPERHTVAAVICVQVPSPAA